MPPSWFMTSEEVGVSLAHLAYSPSDVAVDLVRQDSLHQRQDVLDESRPARHPLVVVAAAVAVRSIQA